MYDIHAHKSVTDSLHKTHYSSIPADFPAAQRANNNNYNNYNYYSASLYSQYIIVHNSKVVCFVEVEQVDFFCKPAQP